MKLEFKNLKILVVIHQFKKLYNKKITPQK